MMSPSSFALAVHRDLVDLGERLGNVLGDLGQRAHDHLDDGCFAILLHCLCLLVDTLCLCDGFCLDGFRLRLTDSGDTGCLLLLHVTDGFRLGALCLGCLLLLKEARFRVLLTLVEVCLCLLFGAITLSVCLCADLRVEDGFLDLDLASLQLGLALRLGDLRVDGCGLDGALLFLRLNLIGGVRLCLLGVFLHLQFGLLDCKVVLLLCDLHIRLDLRIIGGFRRLRLCDGNIPLRLCLGNGGVLLDLAHVVLTERIDQAVLVCDALNVAGDDLNAQCVHVGLRLRLHLIAEFLAVVADFLQRDRTDDLTHVTLQ